MQEALNAPEGVLGVMVMLAAVCVLLGTVFLVVVELRQGKTKGRKH